MELALPIVAVGFLLASACSDGKTVKKVPATYPGADAGDTGIGNGGAPAMGGDDSGGRAGTPAGGGTGGESGTDAAGSDPGASAGTLGNAGTAGAGTAGAGTAGAGTAGAGTAGAGTAGAGGNAPPEIVSTFKAATPVDLTGQEFGAPTPDGTDDATVTATINGAFDALLWVSTDAQGSPDVMPHEWDTVVGPEVLPDIGSGYESGSETWTMAVLEGTTLVNDNTGHAALPAGTHDLTLSVVATPKMTPGQHFRIYARLGTTWVAGPVFVW